MAQSLSEVTDKVIAVHGLDRGKLFVSFIVLAPACGVTEKDPVGGAIACSAEPFGINEGFYPVDGVVVNLLPVCGDCPGTLGQQMRG
jgi:hypothetical protein